MEIALLGGRHKVRIMNDNDDRKSKGPPVLKGKDPSFSGELSCEHHDTTITRRKDPPLAAVLVWAIFYKSQDSQYKFQAIGNSDGRRIPYQPFFSQISVSRPRHCYFLRVKIVRNADPVRRVF